MAPTRQTPARPVPVPPKGAWPRRRRPARRSGRAILVGGLVAVTLALAAPAAAIGGVAWPVQSLGDRGTDVLTIQGLLRHHQGVGTPTSGSPRRPIVGAINPTVAPLDGVFGSTTAAAVKVFQSVAGLPLTGIVDAATWGRLAVPLIPGSSGEAVVAAQRQLREKRGAGVPIDGLYGASTTAAVSSFQAHVGLPATGRLDAATWRHLAWHFELPRFSTAALCDYSTGNGAANWGTASTIAWIEATGAAAVAAGNGRVAVGDIGLEHGGDIGGHQSHERGLDVDLRPMRVANDQCTWGTRWTFGTYDRTATRALVRAIRQLAAGHVKVIFFNDPVLIDEGLTTWFAGHDDHLHVRFCEAYHPLPAYDC